MKITDAHLHPDWGGYNFEKIIENLKRHNISRAWVLPWQAPHDEYVPESISANSALGPDGPIPFSSALKYKEKAPEKFVLGFAPDPRRPESLDLLKSHVALYGVQIYGELKLRMVYDNPDALDIFRYCGETGLPVVLHIDYPIANGRRYPRPNWWYGGGIEAFARAIKACPETNFIGHAPGFWAHISGDDRYNAEYYPDGPVRPGGRVIELLDECPNLYCDMSATSGFNALNRDMEHAVKFLNKYQNRLLFARDAYDSRLYDLLISFNLPEGVLKKILNDNSEKLIIERR